MSDKKERIIYKIPAYVSLSSLGSDFKMHIEGNPSDSDKILIHKLFKNKELPFGKTFTMPKELRKEILMKHREVCYSALHSEGVASVFFVFYEDATLNDIELIPQRIPLSLEDIEE